MSGMPVTKNNMLADESPWWVRGTPKLHMQRMQAMIDAEDGVDECRRKFHMIVGGVRL